MNNITQLRVAVMKTLVIDNDNKLHVVPFTITHKDLTLNILRQLQAEKIFQDGKLRGILWGFVNYHPKHCNKVKDHIHIVWQKGQELRCDTIGRGNIEHFKLEQLIIAQGNPEDDDEDD